MKGKLRLVDRLSSTGHSYVWANVASTVSNVVRDFVVHVVNVRGVVWDESVEYSRVLRFLKYLHKVLTRYIIVQMTNMLEQSCLSVWYCNLEEKNYILVNQFVKILHCFEHQKRMFVKCSTLGIFNGIFLFYLLQDYSTQRILSQLTKWYPTIPIVIK